MSSDYKYEAQVRAEELAEQEHGENVDFYSLSTDEQNRLYQEGLDIVYERMAARADWLRDRAKEGRWARHCTSI